MNLKDIYIRFPNRVKCIEHLEKIKWNNKPRCPYCESIKYSNVKSIKRYHCNNCNTSFSVTVGTIFSKTKLDLQKWFYAIVLLNSPIEHFSLRELGVEIGATKDTVNYMKTRIKKSLVEKNVFINNLIISLTHEK